MITSALEAKECHDMAIIYISGAYRHTCMEKHGKQRNIMLFKGKLADLIIMVDLNLYRKYVSYDRKGNAMLHVEMKKALYSLLQSAVIFYNKLRKDLEYYGFVFIPMTRVW